MQAGGACDCGDEDVMKKEGFCDHHGAKDLSVQSAPPAELLAMAQIVVPRLCLRLQKQLKEMDPFIIIDPVSDDRNVQCVQNMISESVEALERWYNRVQVALSLSVEKSPFIFLCIATSLLL
ncbi:E3 ubiquitin-protein ligase ubr3-like isoform X2 [Montipora foliosa]|uniref:E3 ubiquitin-protein ligase ubr3-like isoform X2 n=1 Tax=Montipora foliosa TaxID=591990 RepID=UPI0035F1F7BD